MVAFGIVQLVSSIIVAYGDWGFTKIRAISGGWIGIVWVWVCIFSVNISVGHITYFCYLEHHLVYTPRLD